MYQFYACFVKGCSQWLQPLYNLVASNSHKRPILWDDTHIKGFEDNKNTLADATQLAFPDPGADTELVTDASGHSIGCVLQETKDGVTTPLAFGRKVRLKNKKIGLFLKKKFEKRALCFIKTFLLLSRSERLCLRTDHRPIVAKLELNRIDFLAFWIASKICLSIYQFIKIYQFRKQF